MMLPKAFFFVCAAATAIPMKANEGGDTAKGTLLDSKVDEASVSVHKQADDASEGMKIPADQIAATLLPSLKGADVPTKSNFMFKGYELVGQGYCQSITRHQYIHASLTITHTHWRNDTYETDACAHRCDAMEQCGGYNSFPEQCVLIVASDKHYGGGIDASNKSKGVFCFKKRGIPVNPNEESRGWAVYGKMMASLVIIACIAASGYAVWLFLVQAAPVA